MLMQGYICDVSEVREMVSRAHEMGADQLTLTPVSVPKASLDVAASDWAIQRTCANKLDKVLDWLNDAGDLLLELAHGARVYDVGGQNVCLSNCLKPQTDGNGLIRNLIFHPDGHLRFDWAHEGSVVL
jgi:hypothetical protein